MFWDGGVVAHHDEHGWDGDSRQGGRTYSYVFRNGLLGKVLGKTAQREAQLRVRD
jgi:hypothetical protein